MSNTPGLKKVGAFWHYAVQVNGQRAHGSTRAKDLATARRVLDEVRRDMLHGQLRISKRLAPTLAQTWETWRRANRAAFSERHLGSATCRWSKWISPNLGSVRVGEIDTDSVLSLRLALLEAGKSPRYANNVLELVRTLVRFAIRQGHLEKLPFHVPPLRVQRKPRPVVPTSRVQEFMAAADACSSNPQVPLMLKTLIGLGLRESELLGMRWEWLDPQHRTYTVGKAKGKEARVLPVPGWLWTAIQGAPRTLSQWVFPAKDGGQHRSGFLRKPLAKVSAGLGVGNLTQHRLRASHASLHAEAGTPLSELQEMLGHKSITTTMLYVEQTLAAKRRAQDELTKRLGLA